MASLSTLQTWLSEAEIALHRLRTGSMVEEITSPDGTRVRYMSADITKLEAYVTSLTQQIATQQSQPARSPIYHVPQFDS